MHPLFTFGSGLFPTQGVSEASGLRPTMIKLRVTVSAAHLKIITGSRGVNQAAQSHVIYSRGHLSQPLMLFHYHLCCGVNRKIASPLAQTDCRRKQSELPGILKSYHSLSIPPVFLSLSLLLVARD